MKVASARTYSSSTYGIAYEKLRYHSLHHAVHDSRISQIQFLLNIHPELVNLRTVLGLTPLMIACCLPDSSRKDRIIQMLIKVKNLNPYETDRCKRSAIFYLVYFSTLSQIKVFLEEKKFNYIDEVDLDGFSILHYAAIREDLVILEFILNLFKAYKININLTNSMNYSALLLACKLKRLRSASLIIKMGGTGFNLRDNEHFRTGVEWIERQEDSGDEVLANRDMFYFSHFDMEPSNKLGSMMKIGIESVGPRHIECFSQRDRGQTHLSFDEERDHGLTSERLARSKSFYSQKSDIKSPTSPTSGTVQDILDMSPEEIKEFVISTLKNGSIKLNRAKRVSIVLRDKVYLPRKSVDSSVCTSVLPYSRQSSATIAHHLLNRLPAVYY